MVGDARKVKATHPPLTPEGVVRGLREVERIAREVCSERGVGYRHGQSANQRLLSVEDATHTPRRTGS
jgi:hypothetical protein